MEDKYIVLGLGVLLIIGNKFLNNVFTSWEKDVIGFEESLNQWVYRGFFIIVGVLLMVFSLTTLF
jgi:hypothetical protein